MNQNTLIAAVVFCLATAAFAAEKKKDSHPQEKPTEQVVLAQEPGQARSIGPGHIRGASVRGGPSGSILII